MKSLYILNLGAGVQSSTLYIGVAKGLFTFPVDYAIFADTGEEPAAVYRHLDWLKTIGGPPILTGTIGRLGDHLIGGVHSTGGRFASIPAFTAPEGATRATGMMRRQCTREYKIDVIDQVIRRQCLLLPPRKHIPKTLEIVNYFGISADEVGRATRIIAQAAKQKRRRVAFPLLEMNMSRQSCEIWLNHYAGAPHEIPRSACVFCPYHKDAEWERIKTTDPESWARAVQIDEALRAPGSVVNRNLDQKIYLHRSCQPLVNIDFSKSTGQTEFGFEILECEGMCGV